MVNVELERKEKELYELLLNKLYDFFVVEKKEARVDTVVNLLSILKPVELHEVEEGSAGNFRQEVEVI